VQDFVSENQVSERIKKRTGSEGRHPHDVAAEKLRINGHVVETGPGAMEIGLEIEK
jgi:hypothetical protein